MLTGENIYFPILISYHWIIKFQKALVLSLSTISYFKIYPSRRQRWICSCSVLHLWSTSNNNKQWTSQKSDSIHKSHVSILVVSNILPVWSIVIGFSFHLSHISVQHRWNCPIRGNWELTVKCKNLQYTQGWTCNHNNAGDWYHSVLLTSNE